MTKDCYLVGISILFAILLSNKPGFVHAWGKEGHYMTCAVAEAVMDDDTKEIVNSLLPDGGQFPDWCGWPDNVRRSRQFYWSSELHFIDTPDFQCNYNHKRDCHDSHGNPDMCIAGGITNFTNQLATYGTEDESKYNLTVALLFLSHFLGDIHQPLHVGYTGDRGGNSIELHWFKRKSNLHHVWDSSIIDTARDRYYDKNIDTMVDSLVANISDNWDVASKWGSCHSIGSVCPDAYAQESIKLACKYAYKDVSEGVTLEDEYFLSRLPIVEQQLSKGGVRLAAILDQFLGGKKKAKSSK